MTDTLVLEKMCKTYGKWQLGPLDLTIPLGSVTGIMGLNGSGKTTLMKLLGGFIVPSQGTMHCSGELIRNVCPSWKQSTCYTSQNASFFENWTGWQNLRAFSKFYESWDDACVLTLAQRFQLDLNAVVRNYSPGNRVKLSLIRALAANPKILLLDEPSASLDPVARAELLDVLWETIQDESRTIVFATHNPLDIAQFADQVIFIVNGAIHSSTDKETLCDQWGTFTFQGELSLSEESYSAHGIARMQASNGSTLIKSSNVEKTKQWLLEVHGKNFEVQRMGFETIAVEILKEKN